MIIKAIMEFINKVHRFIGWKLYDLVDWLLHRKWRLFDGFGLHIYVGLFGSGKTSSMVADAYSLAKRYKQLTILSNIHLQGFPEHTKILKLEHYNDIISAPPDTLILIDEISSIFNSRRWDKEGIPIPLLSMLLQVRKEHKMLYATAQRFEHVDKLIRDITFSVRVCNCWMGRWNWIHVYDGYEYEQRNPMNPAPCRGLYTHIQSNKLRKLYDTWELVKKLKTEEYISNDEIRERTAGSVISIGVGVPKKLKRF